MQRAIGLRGAIAVNVITMIGIGPLITIPLVLGYLNGPLALIGWIAGAVVALCDGLVWAELSSMYPGSGGTYVYLREIFGRERWGRIFGFLFNWQFLLFAPCLLASGYIGFAGYAAYAFPAIAQSVPLSIALKVGIGILTVALLYRRTGRVAALGIGLAVCAVATLLLVIAAAFPHADLHRAFALSAPVRFDLGFLAGFGGALFVTLYDYAGYSDVALLGDEVRNPNRTLPHAVIISIVLVATLYVLLQIGILGAVPWQTLVGKDGAPAPDAAQFVASTVVAQSWGHWPALVVTFLILATAFASVYGNLLGFSRIPYAAARDGEFLPIFARLHPTKVFPHVALLAIGGASLVASLFSLDQVIAILTAGIVLIQGVAQIVALGVVRQRKQRAPFRMPFFPLPALVALLGWLLAFWYSGPLAIALGAGWLVIGAIVYAVSARTLRWWPFAAILVLGILCRTSAYAAPASSGWNDWQTSRVIQVHGYPVFTVDNKPFFVYGAAFFYERVPRDQWARALDRYKQLGINTIDLYVPWNWHEIGDGGFDFSGRTNPRRDLDGLLQLIHQRGYRIVLRPGPMVRNEWRNGGYPAWLLERPEYNMPLHDVLEGRYAATATLQNAHADAAADEWLHNATHLRYASRWLGVVLREVEPWSHDIIAIALDDDQGAYMDNDTWPAPHWHAYIDWLETAVRAASGPNVPVFINTYQMKVTASAPVWAWGNWYQSDAYSIGDHDRAQVEFSTSLLQTQPHVPVMVSEFQAGWLQGAGETHPRPADPSNTELALHTFLQTGAHGIVNFPVQDTVDPASWEAPWANWSYAWDAALSPSLDEQARYKPTQRFGDVVRQFGMLIAQTHRSADAAIVWKPSAYADDALTTADFAAIAAATINAQRTCDDRGLSCDLIDLRFGDPAQMSRYRWIVVPNAALHDAGVAMQASAVQLLAALSAGSHVVSDVAAVSALPAVRGTPNAVLLAADDGSYGFVDITNWSNDATRTGPLRVSLGGRDVTVAPVRIGARSAVLVPVLVPSVAMPAVAHAATIDRTAIDSFSFARALWPIAHARSKAPAIFEEDALRDGSPLIFLENARLRFAFSPAAGARGVFFPAESGNATTSIGMLRDSVLHEPDSSARDYIAKYTHPFPAGTFNRSYTCVRLVPSIQSTGITCTYDAPDVPIGGGRFSRMLVLDADASAIAVTERLTLRVPDPAQRLVSISSFALPNSSGPSAPVLLLPQAAPVTPGTTKTLAGNGAFGLYDPRAQTLLTVTWATGSVESGALDERNDDVILRLVLPAERDATVFYGIYRAVDLRAAQDLLDRLRNRP
jgi:amino acid transporter